MKITGRSGGRVTYLSHHADGRGRRAHDLPSGDAPVPALHVGVPADAHVESPVLELPVLLAERAALAAPMHEEVRALPLVQVVVRPHLGAVDARVEAPHPRRRADGRVGRPAPGARAGSSVHDVSDLPERDAGAQARDETVSGVVHAVEEAGGPARQPGGGVRVVALVHGVVVGGLRRRRRRRGRRSGAEPVVRVGGGGGIH